MKILNLGSLTLTTSIFFVSLTAGVQNTVAAEAPISIDIQDIQVQAGMNNWTPEDYQNAQSMPLPQAVIDGIAVDQLTTKIADDDGVPTGEKSKRPTAKVKPNKNNRLFEGKANHSDNTTNDLLTGITPNAVGTSGAFYSSSRINPRGGRTAWPWRTNGKLFFNIGSGTFVCSAAVISRRIIVTAGHCVHSGNGSATGFFSNWRFVPAYDNGSAPFNIWRPTNVIVSGEWFFGGGGVPNSDDYALLVMSDRFIGGALRRIGNVTGWLGWLSNSMHPNHLTSIGFPGNLDTGQIMHHVNAETWRFFNPNNFSIGSDMRGGSSGGAWVQNFGIRSPGTPPASSSRDFRNRVVGVTSFGFISTLPEEQGASQFDRTFVNMWNLACGLNPLNC